MKQADLIVILGPTATGKTQLAANLAYQLKGEIISADSRQVYKGMDIGTGKDYTDYTVNNVKVPYHLIDIVEPGYEYNVFEFQQDFLKAYSDIKNRNRLPILCGGTGMYIEAAIKGYRLIKTPINEVLRKELKNKTDKELLKILQQYKKGHNTTDTIERDRMIKAIEIAKYEAENERLILDYPKINYQLFGIQLDRDITRNRITQRLKNRLEKEGMVNEVEQLIKNGVHPDKLKFYGLEYKLITQYLLGELSYNEMFRQLNIAIHQFAKRQATWFRKMERNGFKINWIDGNLSLPEKVNFVMNK